MFILTSLMMLLMFSAKAQYHYYLTVAAGGTVGPATGHMIISTRSKSPFDPWGNFPFNPLVRTTNKTERW